MLVSIFYITHAYVRPHNLAPRPLFLPLPLGCLRPHKLASRPHPKTVISLQPAEAGLTSSLPPSLPPSRSLEDGHLTPTRRSWPHVSLCRLTVVSRLTAKAGHTSSADTRITSTHVQPQKLSRPTAAAGLATSADTLPLPYRLFHTVRRHPPVPCLLFHTFVDQFARPQEWTCALTSMPGPRART